MVYPVGLVPCRGDDAVEPKAERYLNDSQQRLSLGTINSFGALRNSFTIKSGEFFHIVDRMFKNQLAYKIRSVFSGKGFAEHE